VNNAGIFPRRRFMDLTEAEWDQMQDVNLKGLFHCIKAAARTLLAQGSGKIVNISSSPFTWARRISAIMWRRRVA